MQQQGIAKGDVLQRAASLFFIAGAILTVVFNLLHPRATDGTFDNPEPFLKAAADAGLAFYQLDHLLLALGIWLIVGGLAGVYRSLSGGAAATWARFGFYGALVAAAVWTVLFASDMGFKTVVDEWAGAPGPDKASWFTAAVTLGRVNFFLFSMAAIVFWLALLTMGIGMALSTVYPKWVGWALIVLGVATVVAVGVPQLFTGPSNVTNVLFAILATLTSLWTLVVGIWVARKAW